MSVKIVVNMKEEYMVDFMLHHIYRTFAGIAGAVIGIIALGLGITTVMDGEVQASLPMFLIAFLFLFVTPKNAIDRAKQQVQKAEMFKKPLEYEFSEVGVTVRQGELELLAEWSEYTKAIETKKNVILYVTRVRANVFPKECIGEQYNEVVKMIRTHMPAAKVKIRG